jgi:glycogen debranching enzyme
MGAWTPEVEPAPLGGRAVTLVEGSSFCICTPGGDLRGVEPHGVFFRDTRILSRWDLQIDGESPEPLAAMTPDPYRGTFLGRLARRSGRTDTHLLVQRDRWVGNGLREDVVIHNSSAEPAVCRLAVDVEADFADLFDVKEGRVHARGERRVLEQGERLVLDQRWRGNHRGVVVVAPGASLASVSCVGHSAGSVRYDVVVPARERWSTSLLVQPQRLGLAARQRPRRAGLVRYGFVHEAQRVAEAVLEAAQHFGGRLPELFCGFDREDFPEPVPYPTSCSPQAWAAATPVHLIRTLLRFDPQLPRNELWVDPVLPPAFIPLRVEGVALGDARIDLVISKDGAAVEGAPAGVDVRHEWCGAGRDG